MFRIWQMNDGRWQVDPHGGAHAPEYLRKIAYHITGSDTYAEAVEKRDAAEEKARIIWADMGRVNYGDNADKYGV